MDWFRNASIRRKLAILLGLSGVVGILLAAVAFVTNDVRSIRSSMVRTLTTLAEVAAANSEAALAFDDPRAAEETLKSLSQEPTVVAACLYNAGGRQFATYTRRAGVVFSPQPPDAPSQRFHDGVVDVARPIRQGSRKLGTVLIRAHTGEIGRQLRQYLLLTVGVLAACSAIAVTLSLLLQRVISEPILRLARATHAVSTTGDYSVRVKKEGNDEVGLLCEGFNGMLAQIQARDSELQQHRLHLEELVHERTRDLERKTEEAQAASVAKSQFLATMSHEIRTPMNAVLGMTSLLLDTNLSEAQRDFAETIRASGEALRSIINDILDFSKIEAGRMELETQPFDLRDCMESAVDLVATAASEKKLEVGCLVRDGTPSTIRGDTTRLRQVLVNLLNNGVKFTERGEVVLSVSARPLTPDATPTSGRYELHFSVKDTGIGIPPDRMGRLFQSFSQVDASTTRRYGGTGLGLAISKRLAEMMGGTMWVESEAGQGSTFHFTIQAEAAEAVTPAPHLRAAQPRLEGRRALIVDDNATNLRILTLQVQAWGMVPCACQSPLEALEWVRRGDAFDVGLLDMQMPEMDGLALAERIHEMRPDMPLVMLTSLGHPGARPEGVGLAAILVKPVKAARLHETLGELFAAGAQDEEPERDRPQRPQFDPEMGKRLPLRILLAEDNATNQKLALQLLSRLGYRADLAANGLEAVESVRRQVYDVVLMDVQMPEMDGLEASRLLCAEWPREYRPRIIAMTANAMKEDRDACLAAGMDDYVAKPIRVEELIRALSVCRALGDRPQASPAEAPAPASTPRGSDGEAREETSMDAEQGKEAAQAETFLDPSALENLREMAGGDESFVREAIDTFLSEGQQLVSEMRAAVDKGDAALLRRAAHSLKSNGASFGATSFAALCREIEEMGKAGALDGAADKVGRAASQFESVRRALLVVRGGSENG